MPNYLVCATQRSGSTLVCELLAQSGIAGAPNEYLLLWEKHKHREDAGFWREAVEYTKQLGRTTNDVWGCKVMASYLSASMKYLRCVPEVSELTDWEVAQRAFGAERVIRVQRRDRLRQAISRYIARETGVYHMAREHDAEDPFLGKALKPKRGNYNHAVPFDFEAIQRNVQIIGDEERYWDEILRAASTPTFDVVYEDFLVDRKQQMRSIFEFLDIPHDRLPLTANEHLAKLSNAVNDRFYEEYRRLQDRET